MPIQQLPALICALALSTYWMSVLVLAIRLRRKIGKGPNTLPPDPVGLAMRFLWIPAVGLQILHAWRIALDIQRGFGFMQPLIVLPFPRGQAPQGWLVAAFLASALVVLCLGLTFVCWRKMGTSWRIGIDPGEKLEFISTGPYRFVRHPIYALRLLLDACAIVAIPTWFMAIVTGIDMLLLVIEACREERYMESTHGEEYTRYKARVGRFIPRLGAA